MPTYSLTIRSALPLSTLLSTIEKVGTVISFEQQKGTTRKYTPSPARSNAMRLALATHKEKILRAVVKVLYMNQHATIEAVATIINELGITNRYKKPWTQYTIKPYYEKALIVLTEDTAQMFLEQALEEDQVYG